MLLQLVPLGMYQTFIHPKDPILLVTTALALKFILILWGSVLMSFRYLSVLKAVTVEHPSRYARLFGSASPCIRLTFRS